MRDGQTLGMVLMLHRAFVVMSSLVFWFCWQHRQGQSLSCRPAEADTRLLIYQNLKGQSNIDWLNTRQVVNIIITF